MLTDLRRVNLKISLQINYISTACLGHLHMQVCIHAFKRDLAMKS